VLETGRSEIALVVPLVSMSGNFLQETLWGQQGVVTTENCLREIVSEWCMVSLELQKDFVKAQQKVLASDIQDMQQEYVSGELQVAAMEMCLQEKQ